MLVLYTGSAGNNWNPIKYRCNRDTLAFPVDVATPLTYADWEDLTTPSGGLVYRGVWDAIGNTPDLNSVDVRNTLQNGYYYRVSKADPVTANNTIVDENQDWAAQDWVVWTAAEGKFSRILSNDTVPASFDASQVTNLTSTVLDLIAGNAITEFNFAGVYKPGASVWYEGALGAMYIYWALDDIPANTGLQDPRWKLIATTDYDYLVNAPDGVAPASNQDVLGGQDTSKFVSPATLSVWWNHVLNTHNFGAETITKVEVTGIETKTLTLTLSDGNQVSATFQDVATQYVDILYADLLILRNDGELVPGLSYRITDYQTIHLIERTSELNYGDWEGIIVTANSETTFQLASGSSDNIFDIVHYDIDLNVAEDGVTERPGLIVYRYETVKQIEAHYDWRHYKFRRWKANPAAWDIATNYGRGTVLKASNGGIYISKKANNLGKDPAVWNYVGNAGAHQYSVIHSDWWEKILPETVHHYVAHNPTSFNIAGWACEVDDSDYRDFYTLNVDSNAVDPTNDLGLFKQIRIDKAAKPNNIIFLSHDNGAGIYDNSFAANCTDSTLRGPRLWGNRFGSGCYNNLLQGGLVNNIYNGFSNNASVYNNCAYFGHGGSNNINGVFLNNVFGVNFNSNTINGYTSGNFFGYSSERNTLNLLFANNSCTAEFGHNFIMVVQNSNLGYRFQRNQVFGAWWGGGMRSCTTGSEFYHNTVTVMDSTTFGDYCQYNHFFGGTFNNLIIPAQFAYNKVFGIVSNAYFNVATQKNVFNQDFSGGSSGAPLLLKQCTFNAPVTALNIDQVGSMALEQVVVNVPVTSKTIVPLLNKNIAMASPDGSLWASG
ncbi:MAG TPA: hypothetical protein VK927_10850, partial [Adhaeribacter sp.]|nr:hypothetical protein [Adhaeribacter sp.]